ncbi:Gp19/Gp15/Gp42 family protein [Alloscardovia omnicolens]|jgi:phage protein gp19/gp15/gp42|uniref:Gp19/Gp15/Gp42 family protein n=1 Tax=Alloscardovia omnicolens TaxID=419015 RepID=UPI00066653F3|nr:Gp19/Gp15/Gp42 family protein [Alloscardovia omnicolens]
MTKSFATTNELEAVYPLDSSEQERVQLLLDSASRMLRLAAPRYKQAEDAEPGICKDIVIAMVQRVFEQERNTGMPDGVTSTTMSVDGFSQSFGFGQPVGGLRLLPRELKLLGQGKQHIGHIEL